MSAGGLQHAVPCFAGSKTLFPTSGSKHCFKKTLLPTSGFRHGFKSTVPDEWFAHSGGVRGGVREDLGRPLGGSEAVLGPSWPLLSPSSQFWLAFVPCACMHVPCACMHVPCACMHVARVVCVWGVAGGVLAHSWAALGRSWAPLEGLLAALGALLATFDDPSWRQLDSKMPSEMILGQKHEFTKSIVKRKENTHFGSQDGSEMPQDGPKIVPRALLAALGRSWTALGPLLAALGRSWLAPGASWADLGASWGDLGPSWGDLGASLGDLEAILGAQRRVNQFGGGGRRVQRGPP